MPGAENDAAASVAAPEILWVGFKWNTFQPVGSSPCAQL